MPISIEEAKAFIASAAKYREDWLKIADKSWNEIRKRQQNHRLWSITPNSLRRRSRYPAWYSILKIRQPLILSRIGIPIGKDTTQDGNDNIGATAAICLERLAKALVKTFDFFDTECRVRDDGLVTNVGFARAYYERDEVKEKVQERITPKQISETDLIFIDSEGKEVQSDRILRDDEGYFIEHDKVIDVENEKVCLEHVLYKDLYVDPGIRSFKRCKRLAFAEMYSVPEFKEIFGAAAYAALPKPDQTQPGNDEAAPKIQDIKVYEYWDKYEPEILWFAENGTDFIKPKGYLLPSEEEYSEDQPQNGLYDLEGFFPCPPPFILNQPTDNFWPVPEYYQMYEIIEDIHTTFSRMVAMTTAIRSRLLFDNSIEGLQEALNEATAGDAFGVDNLARSLAENGGTLDGVVQYVPVDKMIEGLAQLYTALDQRLQTLFRLTGTSDLLQGLSADNSGKTLGERQIEEKYATNQLYEPQRKMAEFVRASYQLVCEMALKNFKDASLDMYIMPQTLQPEDQRRYRAALGMLKQNQKRFRIELETDSTIALNEQYDKNMRIELVNALTAALEKTAAIAQSSPALVEVDLHAMKYLVQGFRQGKMFQSEITAAIDNVIKQAQNAAKNGPPPFNKDETMAKLKAMELTDSNKLKVGEIQSKERIAIAQMQSSERLELMNLNQKGQIAALSDQVDKATLQLNQANAIQQLQLQYATLNADMAKAQQDLVVKREALMVEMRKITDEKELAIFKIQMEQQLKPYELQLEAQKQQIDQIELQLRARDQALKAKEQQMVDTHVTTDNILQQQRLQLDGAALAHEVSKPPEQPDVTINVQAPEKKSKSLKVKADKLGNIKSLENKETTS